MSNFSALSTPVTSALGDLAIWIANEPYQQPAPLIKTFCPPLIFPLRMPCNPNSADWGIHAACSNVISPGFSINAFSLAHTYSAKQPQWPFSHRSPNTSSLGENFVTFLPTASIIPATSLPSILCFGFSHAPIRPWDEPIRIFQPQSFYRWRTNFYQNLIVLGSGFLYLIQLKNIRCSIFCVNNRFQKIFLQFVRFCY